jgi:hypothetical protein
MSIGWTPGTAARKPDLQDSSVSWSRCWHHLEAIARDAEDRVVDRAVQRVSLPREAAEATAA